MRDFEGLGTRKAVLGMVHLPPLPGTPFHQEGSFGQIVDAAVGSARALAEGGQIDPGLVRAYMDIVRGLQ